MRYNIKKNDLEPPVDAVLQDVDGPLDLSAATSVRFIMKAPDGTIKVDRPGDFTDAVNGKVRYSWFAGDTDTKGLFMAEFEVTWPTSRPETFPNGEYIEIQVVEDLA